MAEVQRVRRVIRKLDPWTVFKVSIVMHLVFALAALIGLLILWALLVRVGIPDALDRFLVLISLIDEGTVFFDNGGRFIRVAMFFSVVFGAAMTLLTTLAAVFYNMASDVVGVWRWSCWKKPCRGRRRRPDTRPCPTSRRPALPGRPAV